jgi:hypothetical protein
MITHSVVRTPDPVQQIIKIGRKPPIPSCWYRWYRWRKPPIPRRKFRQGSAWLFGHSRQRTGSRFAPLACQPLSYVDQQSSSSLPRHGRPVLFRLTSQSLRTRSFMTSESLPAGRRRPSLGRNSAESPPTSAAAGTRPATDCPVQETLLLPMMPEAMLAALRSTASSACEILPIIPQMRGPSRASTCGRREHGGGSRKT